MKKELADYLNSVKGDTHMESQFTEMADYVKKNKDLLDRLSIVLKRIDDRDLIRKGRGLYKKMKELV